MDAADLFPPALGDYLSRRENIVREHMALLHSVFELADPNIKTLGNRLLQLLSDELDAHRERPHEVVGTPDPGCDDDLPI